MGYMTTITILNDGFENIKEHPKQFIKNVERGMNGEKIFNENKDVILSHTNYYPVGNHCNPMIVAQSHHADMYQLYLVGENMMTTLGDFNSIKNLELRKELLEIAKKIIQREENLIKKEVEKLKIYNK